MDLKVKVGRVKNIELSEPVSPNGQYLNSSVLSIYTLVIVELENHFSNDDSFTLSLANIFLPANSRFSSIMVKDQKGGKHWKRVEVNVEDHIRVPSFPEELSLESYDHYFNDYLTKIALEPLPQTKPLWEIHIIKYPTSNTSGNIVYKLHHALGDGYSIMGLVLSCLQRADNPTLPLTFPNLQKTFKPENKTKSLIYVVPDAMRAALHMVLDFSWNLLQSNFLEDSLSPIHSGEEGVEFRPVNIMTMTFSLNQIKQIKSCLQATINDVVSGMIFLGTRLYMEETSKESRNARSTALVVLNTRFIGGYKSLDDLVQNPEARSLWGNHCTFLHISLPELHQDDERFNPLKFVQETQNIMKRKKNLAIVYLNGMLLESLRKCRGPETAARYIHRTLKNSSMLLSNVIGPVEKMSISNQPIKGLYFTGVPYPQSLTVTILSYMDELRVTLSIEKDFINHVKFRTCVGKAFNMIFDAAVKPK